MNDRELIEYLVQEYINDHPEFTMPPATQHPLILATTLTMKPWMINRLGGYVPYWRTLLGAAQLWFNPNIDEPDFKRFRVIFMIAGVLAYQARFEPDPDFEVLEDEFSQWAKQKRN